MSKITPANANAESPPLQMVPGHNVGENKNAQLDVSRQPSPSPALADWRRVAGCAKRFAAVALATDNVLNTIEVGTMDGDLAWKMEAQIVASESNPPARRVRLTSPADEVKEEAAQVIDCED